MTRDPLYDLGLRDQGLIELFNHLTSGPSAEELSGEHAALTMFRAAGTRTAVMADSASGGYAAPRRPARPRRVSRARVAGRLVAAASVVGLAGSFAAAGYAQVLPAPLQHLAHQILGFAGVPNSPGNSPSAKPTVPVTSQRTTTSGGPGSPGSPGSTSHPGRSSSPSPRRSSPKSPGHRLPVPVITVTVAAHARGQSELLLISVTQAQRGDVVQLEDLVAGQWQLVRANQLHRGGTTEFSVVARKISVTYRVVLPATVKHALSVSGLVTVAAHPKQGGQGHQGRGLGAGQLRGGDSGQVFAARPSRKHPGRHDHSRGQGHQRTRGL